jgi:hypothetical protein
LEMSRGTHSLQSRVLVDGQKDRCRLIFWPVLTGEHLANRVVGAEIVSNQIPGQLVDQFEVSQSRGCAGLAVVLQIRKEPGNVVSSSPPRTA